MSFFFPQNIYVYRFYIVYHKKYKSGHAKYPLLTGINKTYKKALKTIEYLIFNFFKRTNRTWKTKIIPQSRKYFEKKILRGSQSVKRDRNRVHRITDYHKVSKDYRQFVHRQPFAVYSLTEILESSVNFQKDGEP